MKVTILESRGGHGWQVWLQLEDGDPLQQAESMCIGEGKAREDAIKAALYELGRVVMELVHTA